MDPVSSASVPPPPPAVLHTSTHTPSGVSVFVSSTETFPFSPFGPGTSAFTPLHEVSTTGPVPSAGFIQSPGEADAAAGKPEVPRVKPKGALFTLTDLAPGGVSPMHRTLSLDYAIVMSGEVVLALDGGEEHLVKAGECIVQKGTAHQWFNRGEEWCRIAFVMLGSEAVEIEKEGGEKVALEETALVRSK